MAKSYKHTIEIKANSEIEAISKLQALATIADNITPENLKVLAEKSKKLGINQKIAMFQNLI